MKFIYLIFSILYIGQPSQAVEVTLNPTFISSSTYGFDSIINASVDFLLDQNWQIGIGGEKSGLGKNSRHEIYLGPTYNFSEERERSWFISFGLGYSNHYSQRSEIEPDSLPQSSFGYAKFGKRFSILKSNKITYKPNLEIKTGIDEPKTYFEASLISFSFLF